MHHAEREQRRGGDLDHGKSGSWSPTSRDDFTVARAARSVASHFPEVATLLRTRGADVGG